MARAALIGLAAAAGVAAAWTAVAGPFAVTIGGMGAGRISLEWSLVTVYALLFLGGHLRAFLRLAVTMVLVAMVPVSYYRGEIALAKRVDHPFRAVRECMTAVQKSGVTVGRGVYGSWAEMPHWTYYYYLWRLGEWTVTPSSRWKRPSGGCGRQASRRRLSSLRANYETLRRRAAERGGGPVADSGRDPMRSGVSLDEQVGLLLPGPFQACLPDVLAAGAQPLWTTPVEGRRFP